MIAPQARPVENVGRKSAPGKQYRGKNARTGRIDKIDSGDNGDRIERIGGTVDRPDKKYQTPVIATKITYKGGAPVGANRKDRLAIWDAFAKEKKIRTYKDLDELYSYTLLKQVFNWAGQFRAGMVMIYREPKLLGKRELLLVHHREVEYFDGRTLKIMPERKGPPKGEAEPEDGSALRTAIRETQEETGVNILDPRHGAKLMPTAFLARRPEKGIEELIVYFVAIFESKPEVVVDPDELSGYTWVDMSVGLQTISDVASPTKWLLDSLSKVNFSRMTYIKSLELPLENC
jgi:8-oxo-dGTP pyrophosphatase MutT (NUDIX family)